MIGLAAAALGAGASLWASSNASRASREANERAAAIQQQGLEQSQALQRSVLDTQRGVLGNQLQNYDDTRQSFRDGNYNFNAARDNSLSIYGDNLRHSQQGLQETRGNLDPYIQSGRGANNLLSSFYGLGGEPALGEAALARFAASPDYQFALKGGVSALDNSASAKGGLLGGNQVRAVTEYGQGLATQNLGNYLSRLTGMSQQGMNAANSLGQFGAQQSQQQGAMGGQLSGLLAQLAGGQGTLGMQMGQLGTTLGNGAIGAMGSTVGNFANSTNTGANNIAQSVMGGGTAEASGYLGAAQAINGQNGRGGLLNNLSLYNQMGQSSYGQPRNLLADYNGNQMGGLY